MSNHRLPRIVGMVAFLGLALLLGAVVVAAQPAPSTSSSGNTASQTQSAATPAPNSTGSLYPEIVAYVDGYPISRLALMQQVYLVQTQPNSADFAAGDDVVHVALRHLIQDRILIDHAKDYGISVSDDEAHAAAEQQKALFLQSDQGKQVVAPLAKQLGVSVDDYFEQPQVIQAYRDSITLGKMQQYVWGQVPTDKRDAANAWQQQAIATFVSQFKANVRIMIPGF